MGTFPSPYAIKNFLKRSKNSCSGFGCGAPWDSPLAAQARPVLAPSQIPARGQAGLRVRPQPKGLPHGAHAFRNLPGATPSLIMCEVTRLAKSVALLVAAAIALMAWVDKDAVSVLARRSWWA